MIVLKTIPEGIGKHIVCIYAHREAAGEIQTIRGEPQPPILKKERTKNKTKTENKNKLVAIRFRESDYNSIKSKAENSGMNFTEFVTRAALNHKIIRMDGLNETAKEIKAIGRNLNQLTRLCNMGKINCPDLIEMKKEYAKSVLALEEIARRCG